MLPITLTIQEAQAEPFVEVCSMTQEGQANKFVVACSTIQEVQDETVEVQITLIVQGTIKSDMGRGENPLPRSFFGLCNSYNVYQFPRPLLPDRR